MEALGWRMVKLCGGLPLAIIVLGGLLAAKHTLREWEMVYQNDGVYQNGAKWSNDHIQHDDGVSKVLALSYHDLPCQLKPCFLYFSHFLEDSVIDAKKLYHLWMADGILATDDRMEDETMMDVAERYLGALAQRCMVQVQVEKFTQRIKYCRIHDLMLELCLSKAKINDFIGIVYLQCETDLAYCFSTTPTTTTKIRKLAIHLNMDVEKVVLPDLETTKQLRSILFYNPISYGRHSIELNSHFKYLKLLRVLDLERLEFDEKSLESIGNLVSLRYLSLRSCSIPKWHSSICKLKYLQTLDLLNCYFNSGEVIVLHQMERLRHLYISYNSILRYKFKLDGLSNLETLEGFNTRNCDVNDLCKLINLQQLEEATFWKTDNQDFAAFINYLNISAKPPPTNILIS
ncbi:putative inactive disease susceptibility protein LOV1 [Camellia sinensis]|uniref:putative inactive disease susceptibility protein LOV1 n=1 Tax=Camellia sinensis TaxID=4442 RepID=UPI00103679A9|nr:putative inactive disease susceptibility protein LOV1 [Camellia sinensis]